MYFDMSMPSCIFAFMIFIYIKLGDSRNYMPPILVPSSAKRIAAQILVIAKLNGRKDIILSFCL